VLLKVILIQAAPGLESAPPAAGFTLKAILWCRVYARALIAARTSWQVCADAFDTIEKKASSEMTVQRNMDAPLNLPTPAYRVETRGVSVMLSSDQNGADPKFVDFAKNANVLNMHLAIAANAPPSPLHASPALVGRLGQEAGAKRLILGHIGQFDLDAAIADVKKSYTGSLTVGSDLQCTQVQ